jgi:hypothetical protein
LHVNNGYVALAAKSDERGDTIATIECASGPHAVPVDLGSHAYNVTYIIEALMSFGKTCEISKSKNNMLKLSSGELTAVLMPKSHKIEKRELSGPVNALPAKRPKGPKRTMFKRKTKRELVVPRMLKGLKGEAYKAAENALKLTTGHVSCQSITYDRQRYEGRKLVNERITARKFFTAQGVFEVITEIKRLKESNPAAAMRSRPEI